MRIAIADDNPDELAWIAGILREGGFACVTFANGEEIVASLRRETFDLVLLDWNMPRMTGLEVIGWINENLDQPPPTIMLTSRDSKADVIRALEAGAVDYIAKAEDADIVRARVSAATRRRAPGRPEASRFGDYAFDRGAQTISFAGEPIELRPKEFELARLFFDNVDRPLSRSYIMQRVWNSNPEVETRTLDMHVSRIRVKLHLRPERGFALKTVFGFGYRLDSCTVPEASR